MMTDTVTIQQCEITIPTYDVGEPEKNPMFLENRVYQGSSGKVYPFPVTERVYDQKHDKNYQAIVLENEYLQVTFLPELGGRIQRMLDKTNNYDFVYYNHVIKPALVGVTGPWISGGIEFNWPQHHRPDTFLPVNHDIEHNQDGSITLWMSDVDRMYGTKVRVGFTMFPGKAYLKLSETFSNPTDLPQTFLWWANPAVPVNKHTQSIFPPDVHAVFDHGKRAVSTFPIATGEYYKVDYSAGVDISRYKNVPVPTSYMAAHSDYDFLGNYDDEKQAGLLHVADHHTSPGKKQWTWGNGDFGQSWDHQLTDNDGPYIELMVGTFTDNQPDFTWLNPHEEKHATEYFMPYKAVGQVKNATTDAAINLELTAGNATVTAYTTAEFENVQITLSQNDVPIFTVTTTLSPTQTFSKTVSGVAGNQQSLSVTVCDATGRILVSYTPKVDKIEPVPDAAAAIPEPSAVRTNDELFFAGQHLEQYRHTSFRPEDYYVEGLKRDEGDERLNDAYGLLLYRRGLFTDSEKYFRKALQRQNAHNTNPVSGAVNYHLALSLLRQGDDDTAYDAFYKATWSADTAAISFVNLAKLALKKADTTQALQFINEALKRNSEDVEALAIKAHILRLQNNDTAALALLTASLQFDAGAPALLYERSLLPDGESEGNQLTLFISRRLNDILTLTQMYLEIGEYQEALLVLAKYRGDSPLRHYYEAYIYELLGNRTAATAAAKRGAVASPDYCFPNRLLDVTVLEHVQQLNPEDGHAPYFLGNFYYDRRVYDRAARLWEKAIKLTPAYAMSYRNLAIAYYNKEQRPQAALNLLEKAFTLDPQNARMVFELDSLYEKMNRPLAERLAFLQAHQQLVEARDDSYIQMVKLLNETGQYAAAYHALMARTFHPWEGGEGKVSAQYEYALIELAKQDLAANNPTAAVDKLQKALVYPRSLGEGKLPIADNNIIDYYLGLAQQQLGDRLAAETYWQRATKGLTEPTAALYYNDQPADTIFYQGLAYAALGDEAKAKGRYFKLVTYGEKHLFDVIHKDYFAVSLPDALLFDEDSQKQNTIHCQYLMALGHLGLGDKEQAQALLKQVLALTNHHQGVIRHTPVILEDSQER